MSANVSKLLTDTELEQLNLPTGQAAGLPGRAYYDPEFFGAERTNVFGAGWMAISFGSAVPNPGDVLPVSVAGWELVIVRDRDHQVKCFHNVCRHRGMKVVGKPCNARAISCPYHAWTYGLDGKLLATPAIGGVGNNQSDDLDHSTNGLLPVRCGVWLDFIFVNIDGSALPLDEHLATVRQRIDPHFDFSQIALGVGGRSGQRDYPVNWKIILEGSIEDYHLPFVHKAFNHSAQYFAEEGGDIYAGFSSKRPLDEAFVRYGAQGEDGNTLPVFPAMEQSGVAETVVLFLFPTGILTCTPTYVSMSVILPTTPTLTAYAARTHFIGDGATAPEFAKLREDNATFWNNVFDEDDTVWKTVQIMSHAREDLGIKTRFSPHWERGLHAFQKYVARCVSD